MDEDRGIEKALTGRSEGRMDKQEEAVQTEMEPKEGQQDSLQYYKDAYERERQKSRVLAGKLADAQGRVTDLEGKLNRIKGSIFWKLSKPLRAAVHWVQRTKERIGYYGSIKGIARKLDAKRIEKKARKQHGTASFPTPEERESQRNAVFPKKVKISILVPLYNTPKNFLIQAIDSVLAQTYENWELCLADGSDGEHTYVEQVCRSYVEKDAVYLEAHPALRELVGEKGRILYRKLEKNGGISENTNQCLAMATGEYIGLFDHDDILHPAVLFEYMKAICDEGADYVYCDETTFHGGSVDSMITLHFKPDFAVDNLRANNYICHFSVFDRKLLEGTQLFRSQFDGSQDHDMILRLTAEAKKVVHVPKLLYYWRSHKGSVASDINAKSYAIDAAKGAVADHLRSQGFENFEISSTKAFETIFRIRYGLQGNPKISIVIPNKDHYGDLKRCVTSILEKSSYDNYEIIIVENNSVSGEIFRYYEELGKNGLIRIVTYEGDFNYSRINNLGVSKATGDYVILLNNDTEVITLNWMEELLMYAQREDVGAVGAKLYYGDRTIQHAGVVIGLGAHRTAGHTHYRVSSNNLGYMGRLCYAQNVSAVTGACLMVEKRLYEELGGLDETFAVSLNDVDFCLRLRDAGYLNVFTPFAELYHFESISRGSDLEGKKAQRYNEESERFREKWRNVLDKGDPYYNPNFSLDRSDFALKMNA
ncbi:MAG: glycosyltransferase family 2 protein [Muribaculaceae bacterium]|nr:glycosyltransferase family 2 protein [Muribaculaceae bacterium]